RWLWSIIAGTKTQQGAAVDQATAPRRSPPNSALSITPPSALHYRPPRTRARSWSGTTQPRYGHSPTLPSARHYPRTDTGPPCPASGSSPPDPLSLRERGNEG